MRIIGYTSRAAVVAPSKTIGGERILISRDNKLNMCLYAIVAMQRSGHCKHTGRQLPIQLCKHMIMKVTMVYAV
jgi:hypothetical protein